MKIKITYDGMCYHSPEIIKLSNRVIIDDDTTHLIALFGLYNNTAVREFDFSCNRISISEMKWLSECLKCARSLQYVDLSGNKLSPWGMYCTVIEHCCVNSLTLCGDEGIEEYVKEVEMVLKRNLTLESLTLYKIGGIRLQSIKIILSNNTTLKELNMSWQCKSAKGPLICSKFNSTNLCSNNHEGVVDINILCDSYFEGSSSELLICVGDGMVMMQCI